MCGIAEVLSHMSLPVIPVLRDFQVAVFNQGVTQRSLAARHGGLSSGGMLSVGQIGHVDPLVLSCSHWYSHLPHVSLLISPDLLTL